MLDSDRTRRHFAHSQFAAARRKVTPIARTSRRVRPVIRARQMATPTILRMGAKGTLKASATRRECRLPSTYVGVEKVQFSPERPKLGGYKMSRKSRKSFVGHPSAILFSRISGERVFQHPQAITPRTTIRPVVGVMAISRQLQRPWAGAISF